MPDEKSAETEAPRIAQSKRDEILAVMEESLRWLQLESVQKKLEERTERLCRGDSLPFEL